MLSEQSPDKKYIYTIAKEVCAKYLKYCINHNEFELPIFPATMDGFSESFELEYATYNDGLCSSIIRDRHIIPDLEGRFIALSALCQEVLGDLITIRHSKETVE
uniref:Uncharacterized protein n=1 Tax=Lygus hesperus TaxID=30085 RepID=A0A146LFW6_LYGHE